MPLREIEGVLTADDVLETARGIADWQLADGMIPWFPGGHADAWNHTEAAMALMVAGLRDEAEKAYAWLRDMQRPDGSWHHYYLADSIEQDKLDANCCAYPAAGLWHHFLITGDVEYLATHWQMVDAAIEFVLDLQTPRGEILWARHANGDPWPYALLTGSSSIAHSLTCAIAIANELGHERPTWEDGYDRLATTIRDVPDAFAPKHRWAMDWYYPVLSGVVTGEAGRSRLAERWDAFVMDGRGVRCVGDRDWVTAAETSECALAHLAVGEDEKAHTLFAWANQLRDTDGHYWTGMAYPEEVHFPGDERSTYTSAAIILAAHALASDSPAATLFTAPPRS